MAEVDIEFATISRDGEKPKTGGSRLVNCILEQLGDGTILLKRAPGLVRFITSADGNSHCRGMIAADNNTLLIVYDGVVESVSFDGTATASEERGALAGTDHVYLARNNNTTPDIVCVSPESGAFTLSAGGAPTSYPDGDVGSPNSVCFLDGYFFFTYGNGAVLASGINSTSINPLDTINVSSDQQRSGAEALLRGIAHRGMLFLCSTSSIEVWQNTANPTGFPFSRTTVIPRGLISRNAIAGGDPQFTSSLIWVGPDCLVYELRGYEPYRISNHDIERDIQEVSDKDTLSAFVFVNNGHPFWVLKSDTWTHVYDLMTSTWQERKSFGVENWRASQSVYMWDDWILGDEATGYCFRPSADYYREEADPLIWDVTSTRSKQFPNRMAVSRADFDIVPGVETDPTADPQVMISWSDDGGVTWSIPLHRSLGQIGKYGQRVAVHRTGLASPYGRKWRLVVSDAVYVGLTGGKMQVEARTL